jgi:two-component sensor histidine kinase
VKYFKFIIILFFIQYSFAQNDVKKRGLFYFRKAYLLSQNNQKDSAFYYYAKAEKYYFTTKNFYNQARVLLNMSDLQSNQNDLIGSENSLIKALNIFKKLDRQIKIYTCYNNLAVLLKKQGQYKKANTYYNKALSIAKNLNSIDRELQVLSNIAINYKEQQKYQKSLTIFNKVLQHDSIQKHPIKKARSLNYIAYCSFKLHKEEKLPQLFYNAKNIYLANNHTQGVIINNLYLAEYYLSKHKKNKAKELLDQALTLAKKTNRNASILSILELLSKADNINASHYFSQYIKLNDSITKLQLHHKNQFARIAFETEEKERKINIQQAIIKAKNRQQKMLIAILFLSIFSVVLLLFFYKKLFRKNIQINNLQIEIRHRLKNNLAMVSRFVNIAKNKTNHLESIANYTVLNGRINSMKSIHELLYKNSKTDKINLAAVITKIAQLCEHAFDNTIKEIKIYTEVENIYVNAKKAELIGLIINELITNAFKYAFVDKAVGNIVIKTFIKDKNILILITDDGIGFLDDFNNKKITSYGLKLVNGLAQQLKGTVTIINKKIGTEATLIIPL